MIAPPSTQYACCVAGKFFAGQGNYWPFWWYGDQDKLNDLWGDCMLSVVGPTFDGQGYLFDGVNDHLADVGGRKILENKTTGMWQSMCLADENVPRQGSIQGTGTKLYLNTLGAAPKITSRLVLKPKHCPALTHLYCHTNAISTLSIQGVVTLTDIRCQDNAMDQATVDLVLCHVDAYGTSNGTLDISTNAAPGAAGATCKGALQGRGWTVTTD